MYKNKNHGTKNQDMSVSQSECLKDLFCNLNPKEATEGNFDYL